MTEALTTLVYQAPGIAGVLILTIAFLRHIAKSDDATRATMDNLRAAIDALRGELADDRKDRNERSDTDQRRRA